MKIFVILSLLFFKELLCNKSSTFIRLQIECVEQNPQLLFQIEQLKKTNSILRTGNANLKRALYKIRESNNLKNNTLPEKKVQIRRSPPLCFDDKLFETACNAHKSNGEWTVIQRRNDGKTNFFRSWAEYRKGFGNLTGEFFIGLDNLQRLTTCAPQELRIEMEDFDNQKRYATYDLFKIGNECEKYAMKELGKYEGNAGDSLREHQSQKFTTFDQDNDLHPKVNCARRYKGAWWYNNCHHSNLNGEYGNNNAGEGINWHHFHSQGYSLKKVEMKIRPKN